MRDVDRCRCDGGVEGDDVGEGVGDGVCEGGVGEGGVGDGGVEGFVSLHIGGDRILGCTIVGEGAADMVCEVAALMQAGQCFF
ncbi:hypothetical protein B484DRAFT_415163 [Ochromonadaceae sp. CCMP2298]|nr:hypothetical protein B484DRAFT_415163 [Ochromonadaceae sp. CCMP2298]